MAIAQELIANGFTVNPNNIHSLPGREFSGSAGQKTVLIERNRVRTKQVI